MSNHSQRDTTSRGTRDATSRFTRRGFLGGIGVGAIGAAGAIASPESVIAQQNRDTNTATRPDRFSRMFEGLPPFADASLRVQSALRDLGQKGGLLDANDQLSAGPIPLIADPALRVNNPDNPMATAGVTFLGQFLDHDMTFDASSRLGVPTRPESSVNSRTPSFDLDSVYGRGPIADTQFYDPADRVKFKIEKTTEGGLKICRGHRAARQSFPIHATTSTSSSGACRPRSCAFTTRSWTCSGRRATTSA